MYRINIEIQESVPDFEGTWLLLPRPFADGVLRYDGFESDGISAVKEVTAKNSQQTAYLLMPANSRAPRISYRFDNTPSERDFWFWHMNDNRYTRASDELRRWALDIQAQSASQHQAIQYLMEHTAGIFSYAHPDERFNAGMETVPLLCGTAKGSCIDMNTYLLAAARCMGIKVQYIAGYWFHPDKTMTLDMHCWLAFELDHDIVFWDLAHHLKWGVDGLQPGLNPAGGRRVPMSCGRGLRFDTPCGEVEFSHFSEPHWVLPDGAVRKVELQIHIVES